MKENITRLLRPALENPALVQSFSGVRVNFGPGPDISPADSALATAYGYVYSMLILAGFSKANLLIGHDPRPTGGAIAESLARGFLAGAKRAGCKIKIFDLGVITTPLLQTAVRELKVPGGVMVTASHNPLTDNGFKFLTGFSANSDDAPPGALLSSAKMAKLVQAVQEIATDGESEFSADIEAIDEAVFTHAFGHGEDHHHRIKAERAYLDFIGEEWGVEPHCLKPLTLGPALLDPNGGAACGINARVLEHFGVRTIETNARLGYPEHPIDTDGIDPRTGKHVLLRVAQSAYHAGARFGIAFDYDADRGNIVLAGMDESAIIPPQVVAAFSIGLALAHWKSLKKKNGRLAVVMSDSTSGASVEMAELFGAKISVVETGEINVVTRMRQLRDEGYEVPIGVEGANGGAIFGRSTCRDGLQTALCAALADESPEMPKHWVSLFPHKQPTPTHVSSVRLPDMLALVPHYYNSVFKIEGPALPHGKVKARMEKYFVKKIWPNLSKIYSSYEFANYEGALRVDRRTGDETGGWRINLQAPSFGAKSERRSIESDFIFARGSRTEAGIWRIIVDSPDETRAAELSRIAPMIFREASTGKGVVSG
ncbi:MAG: hypothetical protein Q7N50_00355 [Armatimonadota bacterium]|nr:hypothetical protein [Armatimonadota bacterium]